MKESLKLLRCGTTYTAEEAFYPLGSPSNEPESSTVTLTYKFALRKHGSAK